MEDTQKSAKSTTGNASKGFTDEERAAMRERAQELKAAVRRGPRAGKADGEGDVLAKIAEMPEPDRTMMLVVAVGWHSQQRGRPEYVLSRGIADGGYAALVTAAARCDRAVLAKLPRRRLASVAAR